MVEISDRSVYRYILEARPIKIVGKQYFHVQIARGMGLPATSMLAKQVLDRLVDKGFVQIFKKTLTITLPIDPETLSDEPVTNQPPPEVLPGLAGRRAGIKDAGAPLAPVDETRDQAAVPVIDVLTPPPEPAAEPSVLEEAAVVLAVPSAPTRPVSARPVRRTRNPRSDRPTPEAVAAEKIRRLTANVQRLERELAAAQLARMQAEAKLEVPRVPASLSVTWQLVQIMTAMRYQAEYELNQSRLRLEAAIAAEKEATGMLRTLEQQVSTQAGPPPQQTAEVRRLREQVEQLQRQKRELDRKVTALQQRVTRLELDADEDYEELTRAHEQNMEMETAIATLTKGKVIRSMPLDGCGCLVIVQVQRTHRPDVPMTACRSQRLTVTAG